MSTRDKKSGQSFIYGRNPVIEAIKNRKNIDKILVQSGLRGPFEKELRFALKGTDIPLQYVPLPKLDKLYKGNHQGIIAYLPLIEYQDLNNILPFIYEKGETPLILLLDQITDVRNLGAIARSAEIFGVHAIVVPAQGSARINEEAVKTSAGALLSIPVCRVKSLVNTISFLKLSGLEIFTSSLESDKPVYDISWNQPAAIVVGSEGDGVSRKIASLSTESFIIPQQGKTDSLNVSVATGVILYEINKQRNV